MVGLGAGAPVHYALPHYLTTSGQDSVVRWGKLLTCYMVVCGLVCLLYFALSSVFCSSLSLFVVLCYYIMLSVISLYYFTLLYIFIFSFCKGACRVMLFAVCLSGSGSFWATIVKPIGSWSTPRFGVGSRNMKYPQNRTQIPSKTIRYPRNICQATQTSGKISSYAL